MNHNNYVGLLAGVLLAASSSISHAASIYFDHSSVTANLGDVITLDLTVDFTGDATLGGGLDIFYDGGVLAFQSFDFSTASVVLDPSFTRSPDDYLNKLEGLAFGNFSGISSGTVGTLSFLAIGTGGFDLSMAVTTDPLKGGDFTSAITFGAQTPIFYSTNVQVSEVPLPAAAWLLLSGLGLLGTFRSRSRLGDKVGL